jgi:membrane protein implicated in regulation of membrane protease activity
MNSPFTMVFLIVVVVILADLVKSWIKRGGNTEGTNEEVEETMSRLDLLEERIQVLERIVTENRYDLKKQIDSL